MTSVLLLHQWKYFLRCRGKNKNIITRIIIGIVILYFLAIACFLGFSLKQILQEHYGVANAINAFCGFILSYFAIDIIIRFFWQELPALAIQPYLLQNIRRKQLISFLNVRSLFSFVNLLPFLLFVPFIVLAIGKENGFETGLAFFITVLSLCAGNHFLILFIKRKTINSNWCLIVFGLAVFACVALNYFNIISIRAFSAYVFTHVILQPWLSIAAVIYTAFTFYINSRLLRSSFYFEETAIVRRGISSPRNFLLDKITANGSLIDIEIKSILRNKRPRSLFYLSFLFLFYGFIMFNKTTIINHDLKLALFGSILVIGMFALNYGQFFFAWQSAYFDGIIANNINSKAYIKSKFRLIMLTCTMSFLLSSFYVFMDWRLVFILLAVYLFCIGVFPVVAAYFATFNYKRIDLSKSSSVNWQGVGPVQWLNSIGGLLIVFVIYFPFSFFHYEWIGILFVGVTGLINFALQNWWVDRIHKQFIKNKYKILEGFREK